ncbi:MAG: metal ABC transporter permease [Eubacteriales bacterium]
MSMGLQIQLLALLISVACAIPGTFLVIQKKSMVSDCITHTILLGIVIVFLLVQDLNSPFLLVGASGMGVVTLWLTETLILSKLMSEDSAIGVIFPFLFSIALILISKYAGNTHLDVDMVLLGEIALAPFDPLYLFGRNLGAKGIYIAFALMISNLLYISLFLKEIKLVIFDPVLASIMGISPVLFQYSLVTMVSFTAVGAFSSVGAILVVAFMIVPATTAYLLTNDLKLMLCYSCIIGGISGFLGASLAIYLGNVSFSGCIAMVLGFFFCLAFLFSPKGGLVYLKKQKSEQKKEFLSLLEETENTLPK